MDAHAELKKCAVGAETKAALSACLDTFADRTLTRTTAVLDEGSATKAALDHPYVSGISAPLLGALLSLAGLKWLGWL